MVTNLSLDTDLLEKALKMSGEATKKSAVTKALKEFIARREQRRIVELFGKLDWDPTYDYKAGCQLKSGQILSVTETYSALLTLGHS